MHDKLFKLSMQNHSIAKDFFRGHLPKSIQSRCDWSTLKLCKETFVNKDYHAHAADVLYSVNIDGRQSYLYLLSEHQSKPDRLMPLRLWGYLCQIWQLSAKDKKQKKLPLIYPLVFYHGKRSPYPYSMDFLRLFEDPSLAKSILYNPFSLVDVTQLSDDALLKQGASAAFQLIQKHIFERDIYNAIERLSKAKVFAILESLGGGDYLLELVEYVLMKGHADDKQQVFNQIVASLQDEENLMGRMTMAQEWRYEGRLEGRQEGLNEGLQKGLQKGLNEGLNKGREEGLKAASHSAALNLFAMGASDEFVAKALNLSLSEVAKFRNALQKNK